MPVTGVTPSSDADGRYLVIVRGRLPARAFPFVHGRPLRLEGGLDPGRPRRAVVARPEGPALVRGRLPSGVARELDRVIVAAAEEQLAVMALHVSRLTGASFEATTASVAWMVVHPPRPQPPGSSRVRSTSAPAPSSAAWWRPTRRRSPRGRRRGAR